jgi:signal peptidase
MIMLTAVVTIMVTVINSTVARYVTWQLSTLGNPLYKFITFHIILFALVLAFFYDRRQGYRRSIGILGSLAQQFQRRSQEGKLNATMTMYREHARKVRLRSVLLPTALVLFAVYILSAHLLFFAIITSGSMEPTFKKGDLVLMQDILIQPKVGDIIIFPDLQNSRVGSQPLTITHRIESISADGIKTKGDNNPYVDSGSIDRKMILGKAIVLYKQPLVLKDIGKYFLLDFSTQRYSEEFLAISKTIQNMRALGIMIFFICLALYLILSVRDARISGHFKNR